MTLNARNNIKYVSLNGYAKQKSLIWNNASTVKAFGRFKSFMFYVLTFCSVWHTVIKKITKYCKWANKQWRDKTKEQQSWVLGAGCCCCVYWLWDFCTWILSYYSKYTSFMTIIYCQFNVLSHRNIRARRADQMIWAANSFLNKYD